MNDKVSIICAVYNSEMYLDECIKSIQNQTYNNFELILVDDGSTDQSFDICKKYSKIDNRIKAFTKTNGGVSSARNYGISKSTGKFIAFIDSDDVFCNNMIEKLIKIYNNNKIELCICGYNLFYKKKIVPVNSKERIVNNLQLKEELFENSSVGGYTWNKIFLSDIIHKNKLSFNEHLRMCEDLLFCFEYSKFVNSCYICNDSLINYRIRERSISRNSKNVLSIFDFFKIIKKHEENYLNYCEKIYYVSHCKYHKVIKEKNKTELIKKVIKGEKISLKNKIRCILYLFLPATVVDYPIKIKHNIYGCFK